MDMHVEYLLHKYVESPIVSGEPKPRYSVIKFSS